MSKLSSDKMNLNSVKKHSVRYDAENQNSALRAVYVDKQYLPTPYPNQIEVQVHIPE